MSNRVVASFWFTDIERSTRLWAEYPDLMHGDLAEHDNIIRRAAESHGGTAFSTAGDSFGIAFAAVSNAVAAAIEAQAALLDHPWKVPGGICVRMGIHVGEARRRNDNYFGPVLNQAARIMSVAHAGQIVVSNGVAEMLTESPTSLGEHRLRDLDGTWHLYQIQLPGRTNDHPPLRSLGNNRSTLPPQQSTLVGRSGDIAALGNLLGEHRLVTVLGPGGAGKTRIVIETAGRAIPDFADGVFFIDLAQIADADDIAEAFVNGLARAAPPAVSPREHVFAELADREALLVVDNCEHVIDGATEIIDELLAAAPRLRVLATSRIVLSLEGERVLSLLPLRSDTIDSPGVRLFVERAMARDERLSFDDQQLATVASIARRLDGMPLAIELAAAQAHSLTPDQILRLLDDRFRLLVGTKRGDPRQQSLEAAIGWSYDLLAEDERKSFRSLSACAGRFTLRTVAGLIGGDELDATRCVESLLNKSLLEVSVVGTTERGYRMLDSIRDFGLLQLAEHDERDLAQIAVENALIPPRDQIEEDFLAFVDLHCDWSERTAIEASTRAIAADDAIAAGRKESAAFLYLTATSPDEPGAHERMLAEVRALRAGDDDNVGASALALRVTQMWLESFTFRMPEMMQSAIDALEVLPLDHPSRRLFEVWRLLAMTVVDPVSVIEDTDRLIPSAVDQVTRRYDYSVAMMWCSRSVALLAEQQIQEAHEAALAAVNWSDLEMGCYDSTLSHLVWMEYTEQLEHSTEFDSAIGMDVPKLGPGRISVAAAVACKESIEERASRLCRLARRRPLGATLFEESLYIGAFAWLALESGDLDHAEKLLDSFVTVDPGAGTAGVRALEQISVRRGGERLSREQVLERFFGPEAHQRSPATAPKVLAAELRRWDELGV